MDVRFYSYVSRKRAAKFGLPERCHVALLPFLFPLVGLERLFPRFIPHTIERLMSWALDLAVILRMRPCDVFICMSGMYLQAPKIARRRYGAKILLHRGSRHIQSQQEILAAHPQAAQVTRFMMRRELEGYALADHIAVASTHVAKSFAPWPEHARKLFLNPYGVDLDQFPLRSGALPTKPTVLFVGSWSYRKGADVLAEAIDEMDGVRLIHVGAVTDVPFPAHSRFIHHDTIPQWELNKFYGAAQVFALASREDGFGMVLSQALASGLSVVCTEFTGGPDLARVPGLARLIRVVPAGDPLALRCALTQALDDVTGKLGVAPITEAEREALSWRAYGLRDLQFISRLLQSSHSRAA
jgi:glycosyltransferase involved in cell wall biosynthesis